MPAIRPLTPVLSVNIGKSGLAIVTVSALVTALAGATVGVYLVIDGACGGRKPERERRQIRRARRLVPQVAFSLLRAGRHPCTR
jgi:hypothetical protein